ncbi:MAG: signal peptidase I [Gammaproteobacteria bacterium]|nr:MAG: signal peptidase I [Gammaproteobacteria bacterium]
MLAFRYPREPRTVYIKRLIGLPGDRIQLADQLSVNGQVLAWATTASQEHEARLGESSFRLKLGEASLGPRPLDFHVPDGHYFVIGDNLPDSRDSRHWGLVSDFHLLGHVLRVR